MKTNGNFLCSLCGQTKPVATSGGTGYAKTNGKLICYTCCADINRTQMIATGKATLYLTCEPQSNERLDKGRRTLGKVSNWPGTLSFPCHTRTGKHNIAKVRYDVWFIGPDGKKWHGVTYGDYTQVCHCKRMKGTP